MITISQAFQESVETLQNLSETPNLDAQILLANALGKPRAWIISHPGERLSASDISNWQAGLVSLEKGVPLPYVIGHWEFFGLDFLVTPDTLIPRPESEKIIEIALDWLGKHPGHRLAADIGTGTGCISVALTKNSPDISFIATDISFPALKVVYRNIIQHEVHEQIQLLQCDLLPPSPIKFDIICANLPYIPSQTLTTLKIHGKEPELALNGGTDGLDFIARLLEISPAYTKSGAIILIEIESSQGEKVRSIARQYFPSADICIHKDLARHDRVVKIQLPNNYSGKNQINA